MPSTNYVYVNGQFVPEPEATVSVFDRGFLYGDGAFETLRVYGGRIFRLDQHLHRLIEGLRLLRITAPLGTEALADILRQLVHRNEVTDGVARIYITRGVGEIGLTTKSVRETTIVASAQARSFADSPPPWRVIYAVVMLVPNAPLSSVKSANRLPYILGKIEAEKASVDDAILLTHMHHVVEFTAANLFFVKDGALFTPSLDQGALPGITRADVLELAKHLSLPAHENAFGPDELEKADEIFATNSLIEIVPIGEVNGKPVPQGNTVPKLRDAYRQLVHGEIRK